MLGELNVTLFENYSNHVGCHFPYLNTPYRLKLFINILRKEMQREKCRNVVGYFHTKLENDLKSKLEKADFMKKKNKTRAKTPNIFIF